MVFLLIANETKVFHIGLSMGRDYHVPTDWKIVKCKLMYMKDVVRRCYVLKCCNHLLAVVTLILSACVCVSISVLQPYLFLPLVEQCLQWLLHILLL